MAPNQHRGALADGAPWEALVELDRTDRFDLARAGAATSLVAWRTGQPWSRVLAALIGGHPLPDPAGCPSGALAELAHHASDPAHAEGDATARAETAAALLRSFGLQAHLDHARLRQVLQVDRDSRQLTIPVHGGNARLDDGDDGSRHDAPDQPWDPWEVVRLVGEVLDLPLDPPPATPPTPSELDQVADDLSAVLAAGAVFHSPEAAATVTALGDAVVRMARAATPGR